MQSYNNVFNFKPSYLQKESQRLNSHMPWILAIMQCKTKYIGAVLLRWTNYNQQHDRKTDRQPFIFIYIIVIIMYVNTHQYMLIRPLFGEVMLFITMHPHWFSLLYLFDNQPKISTAIIIKHIAMYTKLPWFNTQSTVTWLLNWKICGLNPLSLTLVAIEFQK